MPPRYQRLGHRTRTILKAWFCIAALAAGACAGTARTPQVAAVPAPHPAATEPPAPSVATPAPAVRQIAHSQARRSAAPRPRIESARQRLQCVPYARAHSRIEIRGDAWTWWGKAKGRYRRGQVPAVGSVLVLKRKGASRGHLAVVSEIVSDREIIAHHANWLNKGRIHIDTPVRDVSPNNDWSAVRLWYTPGKVLGKSTYPAYGFIYPPVETAAR